MNITLKSSLGEAKVCIDDKASVKNLKNLVEKNYGIKLHEQELMFDNKALRSNEDLLEKYNIRNDSVINVIFKSSDVQAHVTMPDKATLVLHVKSENKVSELKSKIQDKSGMPSNEQVILHRGNILNDDKQLLHYNLFGLCALVVIPKVTANNQCVTLQTESKETNISHLNDEPIAQVGVNAKSQVIQYKYRLLNDKPNKIEDPFTPLSIENMHAMQILVKTMDGKTITVKILRNGTIRDMKNKIKEKLGFHLDELKLVYNGAILDENKTADNYKICHNSVISIIGLQRRGMQIFVKTMDGKTVPMDIFTNESILDIKQKIQDKLGFHPDEQRLVFLGGILNDDKTVDEYKICEKSVICLVVRPRFGMKILVKTLCAQTIALEIYGHESIRDIKKKIQEKLGIHQDRQKLVFQGGVLDDAKTADGYEICNNAVISLFA